MTTNQTTEANVPAPTRRLAMSQVKPEFHQAMLALDAAAADGLDPVISELVRSRASQLNGCAFCLDMHIADARKLGVPDRKLFALPTWRETGFFTARERAALALAEEITRLGEHGVTDEVYDAAAKEFDQPELASLIAMCIVINAWNRQGVTSRLSPLGEA
jgi:AhpD family alkylhydroperoxidase